MKKLSLVVQIGNTRETINYPCNSPEMGYIKEIIKRIPFFLMFVKTRSHKTLFKLEKEHTMMHVYRRIDRTYQWTHTTALEYAFSETILLLRDSWKQSFC